MTREQMEAMLERGHRDVKITRGTHVGHAGRVTEWYGADHCVVDVPAIRDRVLMTLAGISPTYPVTLDNSWGKDWGAAVPPREPGRPATIHTTWAGALAWQQRRPDDRRIHAVATGNRVVLHATSIGSDCITREIKVLGHLPADEVPPLIDRVLADPAAPHATVAHAYDGLDDLFANVG